jgi:hypothetical protein
MVGAPKCGTTALARYLAQHPQVFVASKELSYFGSDLEFRTPGGRWHIGYDAYLGWFAAHGSARYRADRSVFYLYSSWAASEIHAYDPDSRVIAMVRDPVDQMHSQHSEMVFQGEENIASFEAALAAEEDRRRGERIPEGCQKAFGLLYRDIASYSSQLERYFDTFGRDRVCVVVYDDFRRDPAATYRHVLEFLDVELGSAPSFDVVNANKGVRSKRARDVLRSSPAGLRRLGRVMVPNQYARAALRQRLHTLNTKTQPRQAMPAALRARLKSEFDAEVGRVEGLLHRDLPTWRSTTDAARPAERR